MLIPPLFFVSTAISTTTTTTTGHSALLFELCQSCSSNLSLVSHWMTRSRRYVLVLVHRRPLLNVTFGVLADVSCHCSILPLVVRGSRRGTPESVGGRPEHWRVTEGADWVPRPFNRRKLLEKVAAALAPRRKFVRYDLSSGSPAFYPFPPVGLPRASSFDSSVWQTSRLCNSLSPSPGCPTHARLGWKWRHVDLATIFFLPCPLLFC